LAVKCVRRLLESYISEKRMERGQTDIAGPWRAAALVLKVVKEFCQERSVEVLDA
jgi:hypothetical protein